MAQISTCRLLCDAAAYAAHRADCGDSFRRLCEFEAPRDAAEIRLRRRLKRFFNGAMAQFRRVTSSAVSHICSTAQDAHAGAATLRVFSALQKHRDEFFRRLDRHTEATIVEVVANGWMHVRMNLSSDILLLAFFLAAIWAQNASLISLSFLALIANSCVSVSGGRLCAYNFALTCASSYVDGRHSWSPCSNVSQRGKRDHSCRASSRICKPRQRADLARSDGDERC